MKGLLDIVARHKRGERVGVYSLCSAHPQVVECALREALAFDAPLLVVPLVVLWLLLRRDRYRMER